jgi:hypothetical protein
MAQPERERYLKIFAGPLRNTGSQGYFDGHLLA